MSELVMINYDDKRNFYRMMLNSEVSLTIIDDEANSQVVATCRDLSATGLAIEMAHPLELGTHVRVSVGSATSSVPALDAQGKVIRVTEEANDCFLIGISIEELD